MKQASISLFGIPDSFGIDHENKIVWVKFGSLVVRLAQAFTAQVDLPAMKMEAELRGGEWISTSLAVFNKGDASNAQAHTATADAAVSQSGGFSDATVGALNAGSTAAAPVAAPVATPVAAPSAPVAPIQALQPAAQPAAVANNAPAKNVTPFPVRGAAPAATTGGSFSSLIRKPSAPIAAHVAPNSAARPAAPSHPGVQVRAAGGGSIQRPTFSESVDIPF